MRRKAGFSLVELMIALTLGLFLLGGLTTFYLSNRTLARYHERFAGIQDTTRVAFELMSREIREAGGFPCGRSLLDGEGIGLWWPEPENWSPMQGFEGNQPAPMRAFGQERSARVLGTEAIVVRYGRGFDDPRAQLVVQDRPAFNQLKVLDLSPELRRFLRKLESLLVCDIAMDRGDIIGRALLARLQDVEGNILTFQINSYLVTPCGLGSSSFSGGLSTCTLARPVASFWYVGCNGQQGRTPVPCDEPDERSLYRLAFEGNHEPPEEIVDGVCDMQLTYLGDNGQWKPASQVSHWDRVRAVKVTLVLRDPHLEERAQTLRCTRDEERNQLPRVTFVVQRRNVD